ATMILRCGRLMHFLSRRGRERPTHAAAARLTFPAKLEAQEATARLPVLPKPDSTALNMVMIPTLIDRVVFKASPTTVTVSDSFKPTQSLVQIPPQPKLSWTDTFTCHYCHR